MCFAAPSTRLVYRILMCIYEISMEEYQLKKERRSLKAANDGRPEGRAASGYRQLVDHQYRY